jgi:hypothetical protein
LRVPSLLLYLSKALDVLFVVALRLRGLLPAHDFKIECALA